MSAQQLPSLSSSQVIELQDALLANADRLLVSALDVLELGDVGLARSLAILAMEESGKAIALHERRVAMAFVPEGEPFVNEELASLWSSHARKLNLVHGFLVEERYWFDVEPSDPEANEAVLGTIEEWSRGHNHLKQRGFYVDVDPTGGVLAPTDATDRESVAAVISHVHQIGWQLRLGEHIEAKCREEAARAVPPASDVEIEAMRATLSGVPSGDVDDVIDAMRRGRPARRLDNDGYRLQLPATGHPFENVGRPGYEAQTRELIRLAGELDGR